jgi:hypothetical protein
MKAYKVPLRLQPQTVAEALELVLERTFESHP